MNELVKKNFINRNWISAWNAFKTAAFTYFSCGPFTKNKERIQRFKETWDSRYIYKNELDKACLHHDMAYGNFKDLPRRTDSDKVLSVYCC